MSRPSNAPRTGFSVTCACGTVFNTDDSHLGKRLRCQCGRTVEIIRPAVVPRPVLGTATHGVRRRRSTPTPSDGWQEAAERIHSRYGAVLSAWVSRVATAARVTSRSVYRSVRADVTSRSPVRRWTTRLSLAYAIGAVATWSLLVTASESFLPATMLAYGPRFVLLLPLALLAPLAMLSARRALFSLALGALVIVGPIMGGRVSWRTIGRSTPLRVAPGTLRLLTFNVEGGKKVSKHLRALIDGLRPDLIGLQECGDAAWDSLQALPNLYVHRRSNLCTASRWPFISSDSMPRRAFARVAVLGYGGTALVQRFVIATDRGRIALVNLHLETARKGLEQFVAANRVSLSRPTADSNANALDGEPSSRLDLNTRIRDQESERASVWSLRGDQQMPVLVLGDFNLPVESAIFRRHWGELRDAFEESGTGFGWSRIGGTMLRIRIDHVLGNQSAPRAVGAWIGPDLGSDHLPVIADLRWPDR